MTTFFEPVLLPFFLWHHGLTFQNDNIHSYTARVLKLSLYFVRQPGLSFISDVMRRQLQSSRNALCRNSARHYPVTLSIYAMPGNCLFSGQRWPTFYLHPSFVTAKFEKKFKLFRNFNLLFFNVCSWHPPIFIAIGQLLLTRSFLSFFFLFCCRL